MTAKVVIQARRQKISERLGEGQAAIFDAHLLILHDAELLGRVQERIFVEGQNAAQAWQGGIEEVAESYAALADAYQRRRAADVREAGDQVLLALVGGVSSEPVRFPRPVILWAEELSAAEVSQLDTTRVLGLVTVGGDRTAHSAILIRSLGIPALAGIDLAAGEMASGGRVALDGFAGHLWVEPEQELEAELARRRRKWLAERRRLMRFLGARVVLTPASEKGTGMLAKAVELAETHGWFLSRQLENEANAEPHGQRLFALREQVLPELETARQAKSIGKALEARVELELPEAEVAAIRGLAGELQDPLNLSGLKLTPSPSAPAADTPPTPIVRVAAADGTKCERCWHWETDVGHHAAHPTLCSRCVRAVQTLEPA